MELYPGTKVSIGPPIESGFYYDFEFPDDFRLRGRPRRGSRRRCASHIEADEAFERRDVPRRRGDRELRGRGPALQGRADRGPRPRRGRRDRLALPQRPLRGPLPRPARALDRPDQGVQAELASPAPTGAATRPRQMLTRIYGTAFFSKKDLEPSTERARAGAGPRPPPARPAARALHAARRRRRGCRSGCPNGHRAAAPDRGRGARAAAQARLRGDQDAAGARRRALAPLRPLGQLPREHVLHRASTSARVRAAGR